MKPFYLENKPVRTYLIWELAALNNAKPKKIVIRKVNAPIMIGII